ncbi:MAG: NAD-dependent epimerase/dehydratase family protein [Methylophilus sp.]
MKIIVLGGNGFIGSYIVDRLVAANHELVVYGRSVNETIKNPAVRYVQGDFSDSVKLSEAITGSDVIVHAISSTVPSTSNLDPIADIQQNLVSTVRLLQLMAQSDVKRLVYLSSGGTVYGKPNQLPVPETHALNPICSYGVVKVAIENYIEMYHELYGIQPIIIRASNPYGDRQSHSGVQGALSTFLYNNLHHKNITIWGDGETRRGYVYIDDLVDFCELAIESSEIGTFNVVADKNHSLNELIQMIEKVTGIQSHVIYKEGRAFDIKEMHLDITKARSTFDWAPKYSVPEGIKAFYEGIQ